MNSRKREAMETEQAFFIQHCKEFYCCRQDYREWHDNEELWAELSSITPPKKQELIQQQYQWIYVHEESYILIAIWVCLKGSLKPDRNRLLFSLMSTLKRCSIPGGSFGLPTNSWRMCKALQHKYVQNTMFLMYIKCSCQTTCLCMCFWIFTFSGDVTASVRPQLSTACSCSMHANGIWQYSDDIRPAAETSRNNNSVEGQHGHPIRSIASYAHAEERGNEWAPQTSGHGISWWRLEWEHGWRVWGPVSLRGMLQDTTALTTSAWQNLLPTYP